MRTYFDSFKLNEAQQLAESSRALSNLFYPIDALEIAREESGRFPIQINGMRLGPLQLLETRMFTAHPSSSTHRRQNVSDGALFFSLMLSGHALLRQNGREVIQQPGDIIIWDSAQAITWNIQSDLHTVLVRVPRRFVETRGVCAENLAGRVLPNGAPMTALSSAVLTGMTNLQDLPPESPAARRVGNSFLDMVIAGLESGLNGGADLAERRLGLQRVREYMLARLDDSEMTADRVAAALHMSTRTLNRLFAQEGTTAMRWLWQQRLQAGHRMLTEGATKVAHVALACGFSSFSHFSHAFRLAFGAAPSSLVRKRN